VSARAVDRRRVRDGRFVTVSWTDNLSNKTGFLIELASATTGTFAQVDTATANATAFDDAPGAGRCKHRVRSQGAEGESAYSSETPALMVWNVGDRGSGRGLSAAIVHPDD
jgi:hypothetical protein